MNKILYPCLLLMFTLSVSHAQNIKIVPPAPNAMKMTEHHAQTPSMYTGTANVSIPLHIIEFDGWQLPLSLSYNATGIRTNEEAGEVGLGWALSATGVISRTIRKGDDLYQGHPADGRGKGWVYNEYRARNSISSADLGYTIGSGVVPATNSYYNYLVQQAPDTEPDIFNYNFFGYSGSFVLGQQVTNSSVPAKK